LTQTPEGGTVNNDIAAFYDYGDANTGLRVLTGRQRAVHRRQSVDERAG
jgi:hypothetical protein